MTTLVIGFFLIFVFNFTSSQNDICETTKEWGFVCQDCRTMATCMYLNDKWTAVKLGNCDEKLNLFCNRETKNCSTTKACSSPTRVPFTCNTIGIFPDPYDCKSYHACSTDPKIPTTLISTDMKCPDPFIFTPAFNECTASANNGTNAVNEICRKAQYNCSRVGDMSPWPGNRNIFYVCIQTTDADGNIIIYPTLYRCPPGENFNGIKCISVKEVATTTTTTIPITSTSVGATQSGNSSETRQCLEQGLFPHPTNCAMYFHCNHRGENILQRCPPNSHFNNVQKACVRGPC